MRSASSRTNREAARRRSRCRGGVTLEMAFTLPVLTVIFFGVVETGLIAHTALEITRISREAARGASRGWTPSQINAYTSGLQSVLSQRMSVICEYQPFDRDTGTYGSWTPLGSIGPCNNARDGDRVRVRIDYAHELVSGGLFAALVDNPEQGTTMLSSATTLRRD